ncbi:hypothetical protein DESC_380011 [Desulfosarcina cetonica]|nr:hypothetical protein DESC_380011 [Desulfosarcina cetonica]
MHPIKCKILVGFYYRCNEIYVPIVYRSISQPLLVEDEISQKKHCAIPNRPENITKRVQIRTANMNRAVLSTKNYRRTVSLGKMVCSAFIEILPRGHVDNVLASVVN